MPEQGSSNISALEARLAALERENRVLARQYNQTLLELHAERERARQQREPPTQPARGAPEATPQHQHPPKC